MLSMRECDLKDKNEEGKKKMLNQKIQEDIFNGLMGKY